MIQIPVAAFHEPAWRNLMDELGRRDTRGSAVAFAVAAEQE